MDFDSRDEAMWFSRLQQEALDTLQEEPELETLLKNTVLAEDVKSFEDAVASTIAYRLLGYPASAAAVDTNHRNGMNPSKNASSLSTPVFCPRTLRSLFQTAFSSSPSSQEESKQQQDGTIGILEFGHSMKEAVRLDVLAVMDRDPACDSLLEVILFFKGFAALVTHRAARRQWMLTKNKSQTSSTSNRPRKSYTALFLQSQASAVFGVDIHPAAEIGAGVMLDHGTGIVIGETAKLADGCTVLHGVTLGGTGKDSGDRHPKIGPHVLIGANSSILGNIQVGARAKIGAGSIVLRPIPAGATAVGAPAKVIGKTLEEDPARNPDSGMQQVGYLHKSKSSVEALLSKSPSGTTLGTAPTTIATTDSGISRTSSLSSMGDALEEQLQPQGVGPRGFCPFRDYTLLANDAPPGTMTITILRNLLLPARIGLSRCQIHSMFFQLDMRNVGYIHLEDFETHFAQVFQDHFCPQDSSSADENCAALALERLDKCLELYREWKKQQQLHAAKPKSRLLHVSSPPLPQLAH